MQSTMSTRLTAFLDGLYNPASTLENARPLLLMPKRTYQPKKRTRLREHGFLARMRSLGGRRVISARRRKRRRRLTASDR